jgi:hypothetical protein
MIVDCKSIVTASCRNFRHGLPMFESGSFGSSVTVGIPRIFHMSSIAGQDSISQCRDWEGDYGLGSIG